MNILFPDNNFKPEYVGSKKVDLLPELEYDDKIYQTTPILKVVRSLCHELASSSQRVLQNNLMGLLNHGARFNVLDSENRDAMFYAIQANNEELVDFLLKNQSSGNLNK